MVDFHFKFEDKNGTRFLVKKSGATKRKAANEVFREHPEYISCTNVHGKGRLFPPPNRHSIKAPITLMDSISTPQPHNGFRKANKDKAAVSVANFKYDPESLLKKELRELEERNPKPLAEVAPTPKKPAGETKTQTILDACRTLAAPFTVKQALKVLEKNGHHVIAKNRGAVNSTIYQLAVRGILFRSGHGLYTFKDEAPIDSTKDKPVASMSSAPSPDNTAITPTFTVPLNALLARIESLASVAAATLMVNPADRTVLEQTLEKNQEAAKINQEAAEANLKMVDILERMLEATKVRAILPTALKAVVHGS